MSTEIIKQELAALEVQNNKQTKLINELMEELAQIHKKMCYIDGTEVQIYNEQMWARLTQTHFYPISQFLGLKQTLRLRLVSKGFNKQIIGLFRIYQKQYAEMLELKTIELQTIIAALPQQEPLPELIQAQNRIGNLNKAMVTEMKSLSFPPTIVTQVMGAIQLLLTGKLSDDAEQSWKASQKLLNNFEFIDQIMQYDVGTITESLYQKVQHQLQGITEERCQQCSTAAFQFFGWAQGILVYSQLPPIQAKQRKKISEQNIQKIQSSLKLFQKYN